VAGPPDMIDETVAWGSFEKERVRATLKQQEAALKGKHGGLLWAVSAQNGKKLGEYKLESPPVFDGMAVVDGQLFMSTLDGCIRCWK